jgi:hypothetical protein
VALPNFLIIGAQKSGTSWLGHMLSQHPSVFVVGYEVHYFDWAHHYERGPDWYASHFSGSSGESAIGEKTPEYLQTNVTLLEGHRPDTHKTIHSLMPDGRLIVIFREPVARAASSARHLLHTHRVSPLVDLDAFLQGRDSKRRLLYDLTLSYGYYYRRLAPFLELFDPEQILILIYEQDVRDYPAAGLAKAARFLGVDETVAVPDLNERVNTFKKSRERLLMEYYVPRLPRVARRLDRYFDPHRWEPSAETAEHLRSIFREDVEALEQLLGRSLPWPKAAGG